MSYGAGFMAASLFPICNETRYWIYILSSKNFSDYKKGKSKYMTFYRDNDELKKNDIIYIFQKYPRMTKLMCVAQALSKV